MAGMGDLCRNRLGRRLLNRGLTLAAATAPLPLLLPVADPSPPLLLLPLSSPLFVPLVELMLRFLAASTTDRFTREGGRGGREDASLACAGMPPSALADAVAINAASLLCWHRNAGSFDAFQENWASNEKGSEGS